MRGACLLTFYREEGGKKTMSEGVVHLEVYRAEPRREFSSEEFKLLCHWIPRKGAYHHVVLKSLIYLGIATDRRQGRRHYYSFTPEVEAKLLLAREVARAPTGCSCESPAPDANGLTCEGCGQEIL